MWRLAVACTGILVVLSGCVPTTPTVILQPGSIDPATLNQGMVLTGTATVRVKPTLVKLKLGVHNTDPSPAASKAQTEATIRKVIAAVRDAGIGESDIQTTSFSLRQHQSTRYGTNEVIFGWRCETQLEIRVKQVDRASGVLQTAMNAGANLVTSVEYTVEELQKVRAQARDEACNVAKAKAEQYAKNFGVKLGAPVYISESAPRNWFFGANSLTQSVRQSPSEEPTDATPESTLSSGSVEVTLTVSVTYAMDQ